MKFSHTASLLFASLLLSTAGAVHAQGTGLTTEQVRMDRDTFLSMFTYNVVTNDWVLKSGMVPPKGVKTREEVIAMRDKFLSMNVWDNINFEFLPIKGGKPRDMSKLSREQVETETHMFLMTYRYDPVTNEWISKLRR